MVLTIDWLYIEIAFVIATFFLGLYMGWKYMAIWTVAVFFATLTADAAGSRLQLLINKLLSVGTQFVAIALGRSEDALAAPAVSITDTTLPLWQIGFFLLLLLIAIWISRQLGNKVDVGVLGYILGGIFGALGTILVLSKVSSYYQDYVAKGGNDFLANSLNLTLPGVSVGSASGSGAANWAGLGAVALALFLMVFVVYVIWRVVRTVL